RVGHEGRGPVAAEAIDEAMAQEGLAGAGFAGEEHVAFAALKRLHERIEGDFVGGGRIVGISVRRRPKRPPAEAKVRLVHGSGFPRSARSTSPCRSHRLEKMKNLRQSLRSALEVSPPRGSSQGPAIRNAQERIRTLRQKRRRRHPGADRRRSEPGSK